MTIKLTPKVLTFAIALLLLTFMTINIGLVKTLTETNTHKLSTNCGDLLSQLNSEKQDKQDALRRAQAAEELVYTLRSQVNLLERNNRQNNQQHDPIVGGNRLPIAVIIFTYNRPEYLKQTLESIYKYLPSENFVVVVSQDDTVESVTTLINEWKRNHTLVHIQHTQREDPKKYFKQPKENPAYYYIAQHYKFALSYVFDVLQYQSAIVLEDDIIISADFFDYFLHLQPLLFADETLLCISAWNDNGRSNLVKNAATVERSNFFPGLGWMLTKTLWNELKPIWPHGYWDDWLRQPEQRKDRDCIRPEISRTYTIGEKGSSGGQFYAQFLKGTVLNSEKVDYQNQVDLTSLFKSNFDENFAQFVRSAKEISDIDMIKNYNGETLLLYYDGTERGFATLARKFNLMDDFKSGVPRTGYKGAVWFWWGTNRVIIAPRNMVL